jgi:hypothetical protein
VCSSSQVSGHYGIRIAYTILVARDRPARDTVRVDGQTLPLVPADRGRYGQGQQ